MILGKCFFCYSFLTVYFSCAIVDDLFPATLPSGRVSSCPFIYFKFHFRLCKTSVSEEVYVLYKTFFFFFRILALMSIKTCFPSSNFLFFISSRLARAVPLKVRHAKKEGSDWPNSADVKSERFKLLFAGRPFCRETN